ncbi:MAG: DUF4968 domain-containing protein [Lysobacter sp.]|nr:DUF4968 domain-containing protein [Lysobacter sp.]
MAGRMGRWVLAGLLCVAIIGQSVAGDWRSLGSVDGVSRRAEGVELAAGAARVRVTVVADGVLRVRLAPDGHFDPGPSWAVVPQAPPPPVRVVEEAGAVHLAGGGLVAEIGRAPLRLRVRDDAGRDLAGDAAPMSVDGTRVRAHLLAPPDAHYYGLGDKPGPLDRRGRSFVNWNTDAYAWQGWSDPLYKSIPFFTVLRDGVASGVFLDNPARSTFDFAKEDHDVVSFGADAGELDYYVLAGPTPREVLARYTALTGRTPLPPLWALGFQQSRYTYAPEGRVREIAATLRAERIPADAIWLDIGFQQGNAPFTVDRAQFPHFEQMLADLRAQGLRTVLITDLHIEQQAGYAPYDSGLRADAFVHRRDGSLYVGKVWPGASVFPDFTLARVRDWWGGLYRGFVAMGAAGFWNDMNEPSVFDGPGGTMPDDVMHRLDDGRTLAHPVLHNAYGMQNARATFDGLRHLQPDVRPFVLTRAAYAGTQRYAATWTGDNSATWQHLAQSAPNLLSLGLSGYALAGDDIGGFIGSPSPELLTRWYQLGAFNPLFRSHAATDTRGHEPWVDGPAHAAKRRAAIEERYRLLPYLYTVAEENARTGAPVMRPVFFEFPRAASFYTDDRDFLLGPDLLVAPAVDERLDARNLALPPGAWYDARSGALHAGGDVVTLTAAPEATPLFVRAGAIVPMQPLVQSTAQVPSGPLELHVWLPADATAPCRGTLYQDDGESLAYRRGRFLRLDYRCELTADAVVVHARVAHGGYAPWWKRTRIVVHGREAAPVEVDGVGAWDARVRFSR